MSPRHVLLPSFQGENERALATERFAALVVPAAGQWAHPTQPYIPPPYPSYIPRAIGSERTQKDISTRRAAGSRPFALRHARIVTDRGGSRLDVHFRAATRGHRRNHVCVTQSSLAVGVFGVANNSYTRHTCGLRKPNRRETTADAFGPRPRRRKIATSAMMRSTAGVSHALPRARLSCILRRIWCVCACVSARVRLCVSALPEARSRRRALCGFLVPVCENKWLFCGERRFFLSAALCPQLSFSFAPQAQMPRVMSSIQ